MTTSSLERTVVGWNRRRLDLRSEEMLAQILDRGDLAAWRELYALAAEDPALRQRLLSVIRQVPLPYPVFWRAALASLGETVDWCAPPPTDEGPA